MRGCNSLEELRNNIIESLLLSDIDDSTQWGISDDVISLCNVLCSFYGIDHSQETTSSSTRLHGLMSILASHYNNQPQEPWSLKLQSLTNKSPIRQWNFSKSNDLISYSKVSLTSIKKKLTKDDSLYICLSSIIVYAVLDDIISTVNSYQKNIEYEVSKFGRFVACDNYNKLIKKSIELMASLKDFDMLEDCRMGYDNFLRELRSIVQSNNKIIAQNNKIIAQHMKISLEETKKNGCVLVMIILLCLSVSISSFFFLYN